MHSFNPHDSTSLQNVTTAQSSNPHNLTSHLHNTPTNPQRSASPMNIPSSSEEPNMVKTKRKRGKTMMGLFSLTPNEKFEVEFNDLNQLISTNSTYLSSYLGTLAREMVPMTISNWKKVDDKLRADLWTCIQARFKLDDIYQDLFLHMLGLRWKESKSRLVKAIRVAARSPDASSKLSNLKPDNIKSAQEWNDFVNEKLTEESESTSNKYKAIRAINMVPHTMSRKGYARLAKDMKKESGCSSDISREDLWCRGHTKKNGEPSNSVVADYIFFQLSICIRGHGVDCQGIQASGYHEGCVIFRLKMPRIIILESHIGVVTTSQMVVLYKFKINLESAYYWVGKRMLSQKQQLHPLILLF